MSGNAMQDRLNMTSSSDLNVLLSTSPSVDCHKLPTEPAPQRTRVLAMNTLQLVEHFPQPLNAEGSPSSNVFVNTPNGLSVSSSPDYSTTPSTPTPVEDADTAGSGTERKRESPNRMDTSPSLPILPAEPEKVLDDLLNGAKRIVDVCGLVKSARKSFSLFEEWLKAKSHSGHTAVVAVEAQVKDLAEKYFEAIDTSVKTAGHGIAFADDAVKLCDSLSRHSRVDVRLFIDEMLKTAECAHHDAEDTHKQFSSVQRLLFQVIRQIPSQTAQIEEQDPMVVENILPSSPSVHSAQLHSTNDHEQNGQMQQNSSEAVGLLRKAAQDLGDLVQCVADFVKWWGTAEAMTLALERQTDSADRQQQNTVRINALRDNWKGVKNDYMEYKTSITALKTFYAPLKAQASGSWYKRYFGRN